MDVPQSPSGAPILSRHASFGALRLGGLRGAAGPVRCDGGVTTGLLGVFQQLCLAPTRLTIDTPKNRTQGTVPKNTIRGFTNRRESAWP